MSGAPTGLVIYANNGSYAVLLWGWGFLYGRERPLKNWGKSTAYRCLNAKAISTRGGFIQLQSEAEMLAVASRGIFKCIVIGH
jgi:hypothetical protein